MYGCHPLRFTLDHNQDPGTLGWDATTCGLRVRHAMGCPFVQAYRPSSATTIEFHSSALEASENNGQ
jgi:hypothetical protein